MLGSCAIIRDVLLDSHRYPFFLLAFTSDGSSGFLPMVGEER